jgi:transposase InsO family protein
MEKWLSANNIAEFLGKDKRVINRWAKDDGWPYRTVDGNGGKQKRFHIKDLPEDIQVAYAASIQTTLEELQSQLKPQVKPEKKVIISRYNGRGVDTGTVKPLEKVTEKNRIKALLRAKVIEAWNASGLKPDEFAVAYNNGMIIPEIHAQLGGTISKPTLYLWLKKYEQHDQAGLAPQYHKRGGNGASLDQHTKDLIAYYYLHKNQPSVAKVQRALEQQGITINDSLVYRYIQDGITPEVKLFFRKGEKAYRDRCEPYIDRDYTLLHSMQIAVGDHKTFDFVSRVKRADGWHIVRLFLTCITDMRSRKILGWWIDEVPSTLTIIRSIRMMVEQYGCPDEFLFDNGKDFASHWLAGDAWNEQHLKFGKREQQAVSCVMDDLGSIVHYCKRCRGQSKPIERLNGFISVEFDPSFESYVGSNTASRPDETKRYWGAFDGAKKIPIEQLPTIEETRALFAEFVTWFNGQWHHRGQGMEGKTPDVVFEANRRTKRFIPPEFQKYVWTRRESRTIQANGVKVDDEWYFNQEMTAHIGEQVEIRISIDDLGAAYIFSDAGEHQYDAECGLLKDLGISEENNRTVNRLRKSARKHIEKYQAAINEIRKDKKTQLEELREKEAAKPIALKVVNGEPLSIEEKPELKLVKPGKKYSLFK